MRIVASYSFRGGERAVKRKHKDSLAEITAVIEAVNSDEHKTKASREKTMPGRILYSPRSLNAAFKSEFEAAGWQKKKVNCEYPTQFYVKGYTPTHNAKGAFREMDFLKGKLGVEVQFGKYAFMVYNVCAKMTIFQKMGFIDTGVEIVPVKSFADQMSTGVSYFEQFVWDLEARGVSNIDIPVLILGIDR
ncbi:MAG: restriction endonuclease [Chloroflexi bacterium]|nr:restriction endonuclease [Chloroflexota bacterium]